jgi:ADP-ribose pyrophosphatase YjhB (NUDIX family)
MAEGASSWPPKMAVCVGTVVLQEQRALWVRQALGASLEGQWSIPWGVVDPGETPEAAALRETLEEAGITAEVEGLLGMQNLHRAGWIGIVFLCRHAGGAPRPDGIETDRACYLDLDEMDALGELVEPWCAWVVRRVLRGEHHVIAAAPDNPYRPHLAFF